MVVLHRVSCPHHMWDLSGPEIEPLSPALAGGFLTTGLPGEALYIHVCPQG